MVQSLMYISRFTNIILETSKSVLKINPYFMLYLYEVMDNKYNLRGGTLLGYPRVKTEIYGVHAVSYQGVRQWTFYHPT